VVFKKYMIFPMTADGDLYSLQDTQGKQIAMGSREVCQTLLCLVTNSFVLARPTQLIDSVNPPMQSRTVRQERQE
jgi:hypothetical protein